MLLPQYIPKWVPRGVNDKIGYLCIKDLNESEAEPEPMFFNRFPGRGLKSEIDLFNLLKAYYDKLYS